MTRRTTDDEAARRGPERHPRSAEPAVEAPRTSPADRWPTAPAAAERAPAADRPARIRSTRKRRASRRTRLAMSAKRLGYAALAVALLAGLAVVAVLIAAPHRLF